MLFRLMFLYASANEEMRLNGRTDTRLWARLTTFLVHKKRQTFPSLKEKSCLVAVRTPMNSLALAHFRTFFDSFVSLSPVNHLKLWFTINSMHRNSKSYIAIYHILTL